MKMEKQIENKLEELLNLMNLEGETTLEVEKDYEDEENKALRIKIENEEDGGKLIGYQGKNLRSLQYILSLMCRDILEDNIRIILDVNNYRVEKQESLKEQALQAAEMVKESGEAYDMGFMSAFNRRIVHITIEDIEEVTTESIGEGRRKRMLVKPIE
jgi:spoIIIJ-associated protein